MLRLVLPLYQLATNLSERVSITLYILRFFLARLFKGRFQQEDAAIRLKGTTYVLGLRSVEFGPLAEVYLSRTYEQHHDFIPDAGWTVFDIGANIGAFAIQQARRGAH